MVLRHALSILALPFTVAVLIPVWIAQRSHVAFVGASDAVSLSLIGAGILVGAAGLVLVAWSLYYFWTRGRGTLAPWDPPRVFVVGGPYQYVRNPMISGVTFVLLAEACLLRSPPHLWWAGLFALANLIHIPLIEEPMLRARFGRPYERYVARVRRFVPHLAPYRDRDAQS